MFFIIMYSNRYNLKHRAYLRQYSFLSTKMREQFYWWEVCILLRKFALSGITVLAGTHSVRHSLLRLLVVLVVSFMHFRWIPFAQPDANAAEGLTLAATMLVLVIGLGQQAVAGVVYDMSESELDDDISEMHDPDMQVIDSFNIFCYCVMSICILATICVIARRLGGAVFLYRHEADKEAHLPDHVMDMLDKSKLDVVNAWVSIKASQRELDEVEQLFATIKAYDSSTDIKLTSKLTGLAKLFHHKARPMIHAWLFSAPPELRKRLQNFDRAVNQIKQEQMYATTPTCVRTRLIAAAASMKTTEDSLDDDEELDDLSFDDNMCSNNDGDGADRDDWLRTTLGEMETEQRLKTEKATRSLGQAAERCLQKVEQRAARIAAGLLFLCFAVLSLVIWKLNAGCCSSAMSTWEKDGVQIESCSEQNRERGQNCTAHCLEGYYAKDTANMIFTCNQKSVEWKAFDPQDPPHCEVDGCLNNRCQKQSHCKRLPGGNYTCSCHEHGVGGGTDPFCAQCKNGYGGVDCNTKVCDSSPCLNGGICVGGNDAYTCDCKNGFGGPVCLTDICSSRPCLHGGTCLHSGDDFTCHRAGYSGNYCEVQDFCASSPCLHGGTCQESPTEERYHCVCTKGWGGDDCETNFCQGSDGSPCSSLEPAGMECVDIVGGYNCSCPNMYRTVVPGPHPVCENLYQTLRVSGVGVQTVAGLGEGLDGLYDMQPTMCNGKHWWWRYDPYGAEGEKTATCPSPDRKLACCKPPVSNCGVGRTQKGGSIGYSFSMGCYSCQGRNGCNHNPANAACDPNPACSAGTGTGSTTGSHNAMVFIPNIVSGSPSDAWVLYSASGQSFVWGNAVGGTEELPAELGWETGGETGGAQITLAWATNNGKS